MDQALENFDGTLDPVAAQIVITECYDEFFEIYDNSHQGKSNFALVAMHEPEDLAIADPFDLYLERYMAAGVLKYTGIDFETFLSLPRDRVETILKRCDNMASKEEQGVNELLSQAGIKG